MTGAAKIESKPDKSEEDRILRHWTPVLLRTILAAAMLVLLAGLVLTATHEPGYFVGRYHQVRLGHLLGSEKFARIWTNVLRGRPHAVLTLGLFMLTLVPLARVAFCLILFMKQGDRIYVLLTAYVLAGLIAGIVLGRVG